MARRPSANPLLDKLDHKAKQSKAYHASKKLEKKAAKRIGGYTTLGSGNKNEKGDVRKRGVTRIEHKATQAASFRVTTAMLDKLQHASMGCDEIPILVVDFLDERGNSTGREIACVPYDQLVDMLDAGTTS